jgi:hypothetical protein
LIKFGNGGGVNECQLMKLPERVRNVIVSPIDLSNPIHRRTLNRTHRWYFGTSASHLPSVALMPSHTAPTNPVTITVMTAVKVPARRFCATAANVENLREFQREAWPR